MGELCVNNEHHFVKLCLKYQEQISVLLLEEIFETKGAQIVLHFDTNGILREVRKSNEILYKRKKKKESA